MNKYNLILIMTAAIWGFALVGQQAGMEVMGPWSFNGIRCTLGAFSLVPVVIFLERKKIKRDSSYDWKADTISTIVPSALCAIFLQGTVISQQYGLLYTGVGKAAFITAFYIFLTPILGLFLKKKVTSRIWVAVVIAIAGLFMITMAGNLSGEASGVNKGDMLMLVTAFSYSIYVHVIDKYTDKDVIKMSCIQFFMVGFSSFIPAVILETGDITLEHCMLSIWPILYTGIMSSGVGYTSQMIGQIGTDPNTASIILSSETLFSLLAGWWLLGEVLRPMEYIGCAIVIVAIVMAVWPSRKPDVLAYNTGDS